jgi:hypothetical protein
MPLLYHSLLKYLIAVLVFTEVTILTTSFRLKYGYKISWFDLIRSGY